MTGRASSLSLRALSMPFGLWLSAVFGGDTDGDARSLDSLLDLLDLDLLAMENAGGEACVGVGCWCCRDGRFRVRSSFHVEWRQGGRQASLAQERRRSRMHARTCTGTRACARRGREAEAEAEDEARTHAHIHTHTHTHTHTTYTHTRTHTHTHAHTDTPANMSVKCLGLPAPEDAITVPNDRN